MAAAPAWATTVTVTADARIVTYNGADWYDGPLTSPYLSVYNVGANIQRTVISFDVSAIPAGMTVASAELTLYQYVGSGWGTNPSNLPMNLYRVTSPWVEQYVGWTYRDNGVPWTSQGGDYVGTTGVKDVSPYATNNSNPGNAQPLTWEVTSLVAEWYIGTQQNYGMLLLSSPGNRMVFHSSEDPNPSLRPTLTVTYQESIATPPVPEPVTVAGLAIGLGALGRYIRRRRLA